MFNNSSNSSSLEPYNKSTSDIVLHGDYFRKSVSLEKILETMTEFENDKEIKNSIFSRALVLLISMVQLTTSPDSYWHALGERRLNFFISLTEDNVKCERNTDNKIQIRLNPKLIKESKELTEKYRLAEELVSSGSIFSCQLTNFFILNAVVCILEQIPPKDRTNQSCILESFLDFASVKYLFCMKAADLADAIMSNILEGDLTHLSTFDRILLETRNAILEISNREETSDSKLLEINFLIHNNKALFCRLLALVQYFAKENCNTKNFHKLTYCKEKILQILKELEKIERVVF